MNGHTVGSTVKDWTTADAFDVETLDEKLKTKLTISFNSRPCSLVGLLELAAFDCNTGTNLMFKKLLNDAFNCCVNCAKLYTVVVTFAVVVVGACVGACVGAAWGTGVFVAGAVEKQPIEYET